MLHAYSSCDGSTSVGYVDDIAGAPTFAIACCVKSHACTCTGSFGWM